MPWSRGVEDILTPWLIKRVQGEGVVSFCFGIRRMGVSHQGLSAANPTVGMSIPSTISIASQESIDGDVEFGAARRLGGLPRLQVGSIGVS